MSLSPIEAAAAATVAALNDARARGDHEQAREIEADVTMAVQALWDAVGTGARANIAWLAGADA